MTIISINGLGISFGPRDILKDVSFALNENDRLGIVGANGCGKSTLLSVIMGRTEPSAGSVFIGRETTLGLLAQDSAFNIDPECGGSVREQMFAAYPELIAAEARLDELTEYMNAHAHESETPEYERRAREYSALHEEYVRGGGLTFRSICDSTLTHMGFSREDAELPIDSLSGGQRTRLALARRLCREPDILILDEPTNHLDSETLGWLEGYLASYRKCLIVVSHDRYFLDRVTTKTLMIEHGTAKLYRGGYTASAEQRRVDREIYEKHYRDQQKEIARQEAYIAQQRRWNRERNIIAAESRQKLLDKMERLDAPQSEARTVRMRFSRGLPSGNEVMTARGLRFGYPGGAPLLCGLDFLIKRGERVFIVGPNGCGKSTLIKIMLGRLHPTAGVLDLGHNLQIGYYDQENQKLNDENTVLEELWTQYPDMKEHEARGALGTFLFRGDDVFKTVDVLSGGERARLTLVKLMLSKMNTLILDEPTNHLDIGSREALEAALGEFDGTLICVSHDRKFISNTATRILGFDGAGRLHSMPVGHAGQAWEEWCAERERLSAADSDTASTGDTANAAPTNKELYLKNKKEAADARRAAARLERMKKEAAELEGELDRLNGELYGSAASDYQRAGEISERVAEIEERLLELYEEII